MKILISEAFSKEKKYILNTIFNVFLGLEFKIELSDTVKNYEIFLKNGNKLIVEDHFFNSFNTNEYLQVSAIPKNVFSIDKNDVSKTSILGLYGENTLVSGKDSIICGVDLFASSFYMLTRWEEYVIKERDSHQRFSSKSSLAYKFNFLHRPIVNEYVVFIWDCLVHLGVDQKRKEREFKLIPTHDVDVPRLWWNIGGLVKSVAGDLFKRKDIKGVVWSIKNYAIKLVSKKDPFDTFDYIMSLSEKNNLKSHFFFMSGGTSKKDNYYKIDHPVILKLLKEIDKRGHHIGFHPSYNAYNDTKQFKKELDLLKKHAPQDIITGRQHFLRFENPTTWNVWEENKMKWDSTMSYADHEGFRCGVCYPFPVFNIIERKQLKLIERPLVVMDGSLVTYQNITPEEGYHKINNLLLEVKKYNGEFIFLWHNSAFSKDRWKSFQKIYERILNETSKL